MTKHQTTTVPSQAIPELVHFAVTGLPLTPDKIRNRLLGAGFELPEESVVSALVDLSDACAIVFDGGAYYDAEIARSIDTRDHHRDWDCVVDEEGCCVECGAIFDVDPCPECTGRAFHEPHCTYELRLAGLSILDRAS